MGENIVSQETEMEVCALAPASQIGESASQEIEVPVPDELGAGSIPESVHVPPNSEVYVPEETDVTPGENIVSQETEIEVCEAAPASQIGESASHEIEAPAANEVETGSILESVTVPSKIQEIEAPVPNELETGSIPESAPVPPKSLLSDQLETGSIPELVTVAPKSQVSEETEMATKGLKTVSEKVVQETEVSISDELETVLIPEAQEMEDQIPDELKTVSALEEAKVAIPKVVPGFEQQQEEIGGPEQQLVIEKNVENSKNIVEKIHEQPIKLSNLPLEQQLQLEENVQMKKTASAKSPKVIGLEKKTPSKENIPDPETEKLNAKLRKIYVGKRSLRRVSHPSKDTPVKAVKKISKNISAKKRNLKRR